MNIKLKTLNITSYNEIVKKYLNFIAPEDIPYELGWLYIDAMPNGACYYEKDNILYLYRFFKRYGKTVLYLMAPPIDYSGFRYDLMKELYTDYNIPVVTPRGHLTDNKNSTRFNQTGNILYHIDKDKFMSLVGKRYMKYRVILNRIEKSPREVTVESFNFGDRNIPLGAIKFLLGQWAVNTNKNFHTYSLMRVIENPQVDAFINLYSIDGNLVALSVMEKLRDGYYFIPERKHILQANDTKELKTNYFNFFIHYTDIKITFERNPELKEFYGSFGFGDANVMKMKRDLRDFVTPLKVYFKYKKKEQPKITFELIKENNNTRGLTSLF